MIDGAVSSGLATTSWLYWFGLSWRMGFQVWNKQMVSRILTCLIRAVEPKLSGYLFSAGKLHACSAPAPKRTSFLI